MSRQSLRIWAFGVETFQSPKGTGAFAIFNSFYAYGRVSDA